MHEEDRESYFRERCAKVGLDPDIVTNLVYHAACGLNRIKLRDAMGVASKLLNEMFAKIHTLPDVERHLLFIDAITLHLGEFLDSPEEEKGEQDG